MKSMISKAAALGFTVLFTGLAVFAAGQGAGEKGKAEDNKGKTTFEKACGACHALDVTTGQRHTKEQWQTIVQSMIDKGADIKKEDAGGISDYLSANFGMKQLSEDACSGCHDYGPVSEQRLAKEDWANLVQSMVDRGAYLSKEQIPLVVDYLAKTYPNK